MPISEGTLNLMYGFAADSLAKQIKEEGYKLPHNIRYFEKCRQAALQLKILLPDSINEKILQKLNKEIAKAVVEAN